MSRAPPCQVTKASALHVPASFFLQGFVPTLGATTQSLKVCSFDTLARSGKCRRNAVRWEEEEKKQEVGTFPSPTRSLMIFVLSSFNSYLKFSALYSKISKNRPLLHQRCTKPFCWGHGSKTVASGLCSSQCRHTVNPSCSALLPVFQDKDHSTNLFVQHIVQSVTCICNTNSKW